MNRRQLPRAWLGVVLLVIVLLLPVTGNAGDRTHIAVVVYGGEPIRAAVSWNPGSDALVVRVLDGRGTATGWTANLETHGRFHVEGAVGSVRAGARPGSISVDQGNRSLGGHAVTRYMSAAPSDAVRWSVARFFGDGDYRLTVPGRVIQPETGIATVVLTIEGDSP